jgi:hypothetical protein
MPSTPGVNRYLALPQSPFEPFSPSPSDSLQSASPQYGSTSNKTTGSRPFLEHKTINKVFCDGLQIRPNIEATIKNCFFLSD